MRLDDGERVPVTDIDRTTDRRRNSCRSAGHRLNLHIETGFGKQSLLLCVVEAGRARRIERSDDYRR